MTRFARAKGSKASNERVPENPTPWSVMKEGLQQVQQEQKDRKEREKHDKMRQQNYDSFLKERSSAVKSEWVDFPDSVNTDKDRKPSKGNKKKSKENTDTTLLSKEEIDEMLKPDPVIDSQVDELKNKINKILDTQKIKKGKNNKKSNESNSSETFSSDDYIDKIILNDLADNEGKTKKIKPRATDECKSVSNEEEFKEKTKDKKKKKNKSKKQSLEDEQIVDDAPTEISAKIEVPEIIPPKPKKNKALKIKTVVEKKIDSNTQDNSSTVKQISPTKKPEATESKTETIIETNNDPTKLTRSMKKRLMKKKKLASKKELIADTTVESSENNKNVEEKSRKRKSPEEPTDRPNKWAKKQPILKVAKVRDNKDHKRRKPEEGPIKMIFNGIEVDVVKYDGFPIKKEDAERLKELKKQMISKGIPRSEVQRTMKLERRRAEKSLTREKRRVCFQCRKAGHNLSECPELDSQMSTTGTGICFKCGSTEHTHFECKVTKGEVFKFASCFICKEQGHIAKQCPDNPKGLYPQGGACKLCGDVTHLKKDCPEAIREKEENEHYLNTISGGNLETIDEGLEKSTPKSTIVKNKIVKF